MLNPNEVEELKSVGGFFSAEIQSAVRAELEMILTAPPFTQSNRCKGFLSYVVLQTLSGRASELKERTIGIALFNRALDYDTGADSIVRVTSNEIRKRIGQFYRESRQAHQVQIELPRGSYVPEFRIHQARQVVRTIKSEPSVDSGAEQSERETASTAEKQSAAIQIEIPATNQAVHAESSVAALSLSAHTSGPQVIQDHSPRRPHRKMWIALSAIAVAIFGLAMASRTIRPMFFPSGFDRFWAPVAAEKNTALISIGEFRTYQVEFVPNNGRSRFSFSWMLGQKGTIPIGIKALIFANSTAATKVAVLLTQKQVPVELRLESETDYADFSKRPVILIGPYDNDWTVNLTDTMRFRFEIDYDKKNLWIADRDKPSDRVGFRSYSDYLAKTFEDYAIVARTISTSTGHPTIILAGLSPLGTTSASDFVSNPKYLNDFSRAAPQGWEKKNIEFLIATNVVDDVAGPPRIVAYTLW